MLVSATLASLAFSKMPLIPVCEEIVLLGEMVQLPCEQDNFSYLASLVVELLSLVLRLLF